MWGNKIKSENFVGTLLYVQISAILIKGFTNLETKKKRNFHPNLTVIV